jgi:hypothetical protein
LLVKWDDEKDDLGVPKDENDEEGNEKIEDNQPKPELLKEMKISVFSEVVVSLHVNQHKRRLDLEVKLVRDKKKIETAAKQKVIKKRSDN